MTDKERILVAREALFTACEQAEYIEDRKATFILINKETIERALTLLNYDVPIKIIKP